jgi:hypothetical protein
MGVADVVDFINTFLSMELLEVLQSFVGTLDVAIQGLSS